MNSQHVYLLKFGLSRKFGGISCYNWVTRIYFSYFIAVHNIMKTRQLDARSVSSGTSSRISTAYMESIVERLLMTQHRDSTAKTYLSVWRQFNSFILSLDVKPKLWEDRATLFIGYLINRGVQSSTVKSYVSAIKKTWMAINGMITLYLSGLWLKHAGSLMALLELDCPFNVVYWKSFFLSCRGILAAKFTFVCYIKHYLH